MKFICEESTIIDIEDGEAASANPKEAAMAIIRRSEGYFTGRKALLKVLDIIHVGRFVNAFEMRKDSPRWQCTVVFLGEWMSVHPGESQLFTFISGASLENTMGNAHCIGYNSASELITYDKDDVVPMTIVDVAAHHGSDKFGCSLVPWMANVQRAPFYFEGDVNEVEKKALESLRSNLEELTKLREKTELPEAKKALELMGAGDGRKISKSEGEVITLEDMLERIVSSSDAFPPSSVSLNLSKGTCMWSSVDEIPSKEAVARPFDAINTMYVRELSLLEMGLELGQFHKKRLEGNKQLTVWTVASKARPE